MHKDHPVVSVPWEATERRESTGSQATQEPPESPAWGAPEEKRARKVNPDRLEPQAPLAVAAPPVTTAPRETLGRSDSSETQDPPERLVSLDWTV